MRYLPNGREIGDLWTEGVPFLFQVKVYEWDTYNDNMVYKRERGWTLPVQNFAKYPLGNMNAGQSYFIAFWFSTDEQQTKALALRWFTFWMMDSGKWNSLKNDKKYIESEMYKTLKCAGQMLDAILKEHHPLQSWRARNSKGKRDRKELSKMLSCTLVIIIIQKTFCNCQNFVVM